MKEFNEADEIADGMRVAWGIYCTSMQFQGLNPRRSLDTARKFVERLMKGESRTLTDEVASSLINNRS
jgi:hypothetical protein